MFIFSHLSVALPLHIAVRRGNPPVVALYMLITNHLLPNQQTYD